MLIIGEKINSTRKVVGRAIESKDTACLQKMAKDQVQAGADFLDVNAGAFPDREPELLKWLVEVVREVVDVPLVIDSPSPQAIEAGLLALGDGKALINSITAETAKYEAVLPLVKEHQVAVLALALGDEGPTQTAEERLEVARRLIQGLCDDGVAPEQIYLDPLIQPVSVQNDFGQIAIETLRGVKQEFEGVHTTCGLSNISFGLPARARLNRCFLVMAMAAGLDSAILDPLDQDLMGDIRASRTLLGQDRHCMDYIRAYRERKKIR